MVTTALQCLYYGKLAYMVVHVHWQPCMVLVWTLSCLNTIVVHQLAAMCIILT